jgi:hypothetical protein
VERGEISRNDAYDAPQYARIAYGENDYDSLYYLIKYVGAHDPYVITLSVKGMRVDGELNTCPVITEEQMNAATAVRGVILDFHRSQVMMRPEDESPYFAYGIKTLIRSLKSSIS